MNLSFLTLELCHCNPFPSAKATNKAKESDFANFYPKIGCRGGGNVPLAIGKRESDR